MDISKILCENEGELVTEDGTVRAIIMDAELDPIQCYFDSEGNITLHTVELSYIELSPRNLEQLQELSMEAEDFYRNEK